MFLSLALGVIYHLLVLGLCAYLMARGVTHSFVGLFACGSLLQMVPQIGIVLIQRAPGGFSGNAGLMPTLSVIGTIGTLCCALAFVSLAQFLLRTDMAKG